MTAGDVLEILYAAGALRKELRTAMLNRWLIIVALVGIPAASAKTYNVSLADPCVVHNLQLKPGQYRLMLNGPNAIFTEANGKVFKTPVKVEQAGKKFGETEVEMKMIAGKQHIEEIRLQGTTTKLEFN